LKLKVVKTVKEVANQEHQVVVVVQAVRAVLTVVAAAVVLVARAVALTVAVAVLTVVVVQQADNVVHLVPAAAVQENQAAEDNILSF